MGTIHRGGLRTKRENKQKLQKRRKRWKQIITFSYRDHFHSVWNLGYMPPWVCLICLEGLVSNSSIQPTDTGDELWWERIREITKGDPGKECIEEIPEATAEADFFFVTKSKEAQQVVKDTILASCLINEWIAVGPLKSFVVSFDWKVEVYAICLFPTHFHK